MSEIVNDKVKVLKEKIAKLLAEYRVKHDELDIATEEWDIAENQVALDEYDKEIKKLKKQLHDLEVA
jgi:cupin superfamily acireductone dioxygenase involved in methionine salvage